MELRLLRYFLTVAKEQSFTKAAEQLRCRRIDPTTAERSYHAVICDHCASIVEENFADAVAEGFEEK